MHFEELVKPKHVVSNIEHIICNCRLEDFKEIEKSEYEFKIEYKTDDCSVSIFINGTEIKVTDYLNGLNIYFINNTISPEDLRNYKAENDGFKKLYCVKKTITI